MSTPSRRGNLLLAGASVVLLVAAVLVWQLLGTDEPEQGVVAGVVPTGTPSPTAPSTSATPAPIGTPVAPPPPAPVVPEPDRLLVPRLGLDLAVDPTGVAEDGQMALPERVDTVGWYRFGPAPGASAGSSVLAGHVDSEVYGKGPLAALRNAQAGDEVRVQRADGTTLAYAVRSVEVIERQALPVDALFAREGEAVLRVLTCGGPYTPGTGYRDNVVVTAVLVGTA